MTGGEDLGVGGGTPNGLLAAPGLTIPWDEIVMRATRGGGPGGQNVNKVATRVEVTWNIAGSRSLDAAIRAHLLVALASRLDAAGTLRIVSRRHRTQGANRRAALERLAEIVARALQPKPVRRPTSRPARARQARLSDKRKVAEKKKRRGVPDPD